MQAIRLSRHRFVLLSALLLAFQALGGSSFAGEADDGPELNVQLDPKDIFMGETATYLVQVRNLKNGAKPNLSDFDKDFSVKEAGDQSQNSTSVNWVNGNVTQRTVYAHIYQYTLSPKRAGLLTVPAPFITVDGQKFVGVPSQLNVRSQEKQDIVLAEIVPSKTRVYPTQPFDVTLRILIRPTPTLETREPLSLLERPVDLQLDWVEPVGGLSTGDASSWLSPLLSHSGKGFTINGLTSQDNNPFSMLDGPRAAVFNLSVPAREKRNGTDGKPIDYYVYELKRTFTPQRIGTFTFGGATLKGTFAEKVNGRQYTPRRLVMNIPPATVEVHDVPAPAPPTYCGALGTYKLTAAATPLALRVGDPLTLKLEFERGKDGGALELISAPDISAVPQIASDFEVIDKAPTGEVSGSKKTFSYGLRPKKPGATIPALTVSVFSVEKEKFSELTTPPIALNVTQTSQVGAADLISGSATQKALDIKNRTGGVVQNFQDITALQDQSANPVHYALAAVLMWIACGAASFLVSRRRHLANDAAWQRRQRARPDAEANLKQAREALGKSDAATAGKFTRDAVAGMIGNLLDLPIAGMTAKEANTALTTAKASEPTRKAAVELLESIEALEYAPAAGQNVAGMVESAGKLLPELQRELSR